MMVSCILQLGSKKTLSIVANRQLIVYTEFGEMSEIPAFLYKIGVDELVIYCQGSLALQVPDDAYKVSLFEIQKSPMYSVISEKDVMFIINLAKALGIPKVSAVGYTDFVKYKFRNKERVIVVDSYLKNYAIFCIENGEFLDFKRCSAVNLKRKIGSFMKEFKCPVISITDSYDIIDFKEMLDNSNNIPKLIMSEIEFIPFCLKDVGVDLVRPAMNPGNPSDWVDEKKEEPKQVVEETPEDLLNAFETADDGKVDFQKIDGGESDLFSQVEDEQSKENESSLRQAEEIIQEAQEKEVERNILERKKDVSFLNRVMKISIIALAVAIILLIILAIVFSSKANSEKEKYSIAKEKYKSVYVLNDYLSGNNNSNPMIAISTAYSNLKDLDVCNLNYAYGNTSVTVQYKKSEGQENVKKLIDSVVPVKETALMSSYKVNNEEYEKSQFRISFS